MALNNSNMPEFTDFYLYSDHVIPKKKKDQSTKEHPKRHLDPVADQIVFVSIITKDNDRKFVACRTNAFGQVLMLNPNFTAVTPLTGPVMEHEVKDKNEQLVIKKGCKLTLIMPPKDLVRYSLAANGDQWASQISDYMKQHKGIDLVSEEIDIADLRKPDPKPDDNDAVDLDEQYRVWHKGKSNKKRFHVLALPKTRGIVFMFSNDIFEDARIELWPPNIPIKTENALRNYARLHEGTVYAAIFGTPEQLPSPEEGSSDDKYNLYTIKISLPEDYPDHILRNPLLADERCYYLKEHIRFGIRHPAGEYDVVNADPISLEESIMTQFSSLYADKIILAKKKESAFKTQKDEKKPENNQSDLLPSALEPWAKGMAWNYDKARMSVKLINSDQLHKRAKILLDVIYNELGLDQDQYHEFEAVKKSIDLIYGGIKLKGIWEKFVAEKLYSTIKGFALKNNTDWNTIKSCFVSNNWFQKMEFTQNKLVYQIKNLDEGSMKRFKDLMLDNRKQGLAKMAQKAGKVVRGVDAAISFYEAANTFDEIMDLYEKDGQLKERLTSISSEYQEFFNDFPSRERMGMLERYRTATVASKDQDW